MAIIKYGQTLAGKLWFETLQNNFGTDGRFARGKSYFSKGLVKKFSINNSLAQSSIKGNYGYYTVSFSFLENGQKKEKIVQYFKDNPLACASILNGELSEQFFDWAKKDNLELFVNVKNSLDRFKFVFSTNYQASCNCYDFYDQSSPCKHILALLFALAKEIDHNPLILLQLHSIDPKELLDLALETDTNNTQEDGKKNIQKKTEDEISYPIEICFEDEPKKISKFSQEPIEILHFENLTNFILSFIPSSPPFAPIDYKEVLREFYKTSSLKLPQIVSPFYNEDIDKIERIFKEVKIEIIVPKTFRTSKVIVKHPIFKQEEIVGSIFKHYAIESNLLGCSMEIITFVKLFLSFRGEDGNGYYRYFYQLCRIGYLLLNGNNFIPSVAKEVAKSRFYIAWIPFEGDTLNRQFKIMEPNMVACVRHIQKGAYFEPKCGSKMFLSAFFSEYVVAMNFMHKRMFNNPPDISKTFFQGLPYVQKGAGKYNTDRAVANTFSILTLSKGNHKLAIELSRSFVQQEGYDLSLFVVLDSLKFATLDSQNISNSTNSTTLNLGDNECFLEPFSCAIEKNSSKELLKQVSLIAPFLPQAEALFKNKSVHLEKGSFEDFILQKAPILNSLGVKLILPKELHHLLKPRLLVAAKTKKTPIGLNSFLDLQKILEYDWTIAIGEHTLSVEEFKELVKEQGRQLIEYKNSFIVLDLDELGELFARANKKPKLTLPQMLRENFAGNIFLDKELKDFLHKLFLPANVVIPTNLNATLREYQKKGVEWGVSNLLNNFGIILADDMGLGKTIQTICIILYLYENGYAKGRSLVVVPTSLLNNWQNELTKFAPDLSFSLFYGQGRVIQDGKIIITTYDTLKRDTALKNEKFDIIVIDEAQKIKNHQTLAAQSIKSIESKYKIALSGTPVENSLAELWSIFDFTINGYLGDLKQFIDNYAKPIEIEKDYNVAQMLKNITAPFMLRRLKTDKNIINDLPDKIIIDEYATMTPKQAALYQNIVDETLKKLKSIEPQNKFGLIFKLITELKQVCNHPKNFDKISQADAQLSGKSALLLELLEPIIARGEKVLIFTQYVQMANILSQIIEKELLIEPLILDGSMSKKAREDVVAKFEESFANPIFILSLKAGGIGLNLTSASNVIHYDLWFNPAVENQATDRAFRIGQNKNVFVYRLITKNSFEEKIDNMIKSKIALGEMSVAVGDKNIANMSQEEIASLLKLEGQ